MASFVLLRSMLCRLLWLVCMDIDRVAEIEVLACSRQLLFSRMDSTGRCLTNGFRESKCLIVKLIAPLLKSLAEVGVVIRTPCVHCKILLLMLFICGNRETRVKPEKRHDVVDQLLMGFLVNLVKVKGKPFVLSLNSLGDLCGILSQLKYSVNQLQIGIGPRNIYSLESISLPCLVAWSSVIFAPGSKPGIDDSKRD